MTYCKPIDQSNYSLKYAEFDLNGRKLFVVINHPTVLLCWLTAFRYKLIDRNSRIVHIDKHADLNISASNINISRKLLKMDISTQENLVSRKLHPDHSEFIVNAMFCGLIQHGVAVGFDCRGNVNGEFIADKNPMTGKIVFNDCDKRSHIFYTLKSHNLDKLEKRMKEIFGQTHHLKTNPFNGQLILDIDLDYFTREDRKSRKFMLQRKQNIEKQMQNKYLKDLFERSKVVTIALEPKFCGGINNTLCILGLLERFVPALKGLDVVENCKRQLIDK